MHSTEQLLGSSFRTIFLSVIAGLLMATITPAAAQNSVPPTAVEAAKMPQFASRLAPPGKPQATRKPAAANRPRPLDGNDFYDNGPINGNTDAWTINFGFIVSESFTVANDNTSVTGMSFGAWLFSGDTLQSVQISITSGPNGGTTYFNGVADFTEGSCVTNQYGYPVCIETSGGFNLPLNSGTYWVNLQNAVVSNGDPVYWDENSGAGCESPGCPSQADDSDYGTIPSESFTILGNTSSTCADVPMPDGAPAAQAKVLTAPPSPDQAFNVIYNFTGGADGAGPTNLTMDADGNLYGVAGSGGSSGEGTVFKLTPSVSGWRFTRLYSFSGTNGKGPDGPPAVASNGIVYGATGAGGSHGDGVLFGLSPSGAILPSVFSNWTERLLYSFTGGSDGSQPGDGLVLDTSGNIYGTAYGGGANGKGTLYEFTNGSLHVLHAFSGSPGDGANPQGVIQGQGGLFGTTKYGGGLNSGTVFTTAGGYQMLYAFEPGIGGGNPVSLAADQAGNLYVTTTWAPLTCTPGGAMLYQLSYPDWNIEGIWNWAIYGGTESSWVATDTSGNVYGTTNYGTWGQGEVFKLTCCWTYTPLYDFSGGTDGGGIQAAPVVDAQGNVYGTTSAGGAYGYGVVWEISP
jgi:uncharacterized repeat protein (TIGR03803 family)